jgi:molybdopterin-synthase adenylyltransferase
MKIISSSKPRLPEHYSTWSEPPDGDGDESLHFVSEQRRLKLKGHSFREFVQRVVPLLDGARTVEEIAKEVGDVFAQPDLVAALELLAQQNVLEEGAPPVDGRPELLPQVNLFHELGLPAGEMMDRLRRARVAVVGLGGAGAAVAYALALNGIGRVDCVDPAPVERVDLGFSPVYRREDLGRSRAEIVAERLGQVIRAGTGVAHTQPLEAEDALCPILEGSTLVVCCVDAGLRNLIYKLNRVCLRLKMRWATCHLAGAEIVVGPMIVPFETACYLCYRMRSVACTTNPEDGFAHEQYLDRHKRDDSGRRENLLVGAGLAAHLLALEILKEITGIGVPLIKGKVAVFDAMEGKFSRHVVLRKPWCPACFPPAASAQNPDTTHAQG